jgi:hypothetical protein
MHKNAQIFASTPTGKLPCQPARETKGMAGLVGHLSLSKGSSWHGPL